MILIIAIIILILVLIIINKENFVVINSDILDYLKKNVDNKVNTYLCFNNDDLLKQIVNDGSATCESIYPTVSDIYNKTYMFEGQRYSFNDLCPNTTNQNSLLCTKKHNNEIQALNSQLNKLISEVSYSSDNKLFELDNELSTYRNDKFRLYNTPHVAKFMKYYNETQEL